MNIFITGEQGFIAKNLKKRSKHFKNMNIVTGAVDYLNMHKTGEPCVYQNSIEQWKLFFEYNKINVINNIKCDKKNIYFNNKPIVFIHTHFNKKDCLFHEFNTMF